MPTSFGYVLQTPVAVAGADVVRPYVQRAQQPFLGFGLITPFRRDQKSDFATSGGEVLVKSCVSQILGTDASDDAGNIGELPWRPEFGSWLYKMRHKNNDNVLKHIGRVYVAEAIARWEPRVVFKSVSVGQQASTPTGPEDVLVIHMRYDVVASNVPGNQVVIENVEQTIEVSP